MNATKSKIKSHLAITSTCAAHAISQITKANAM